MENKKKADKPADETLHAEEAQTTFEGKVNRYGFIHLKKTLMKAWNLTRGVEQPITIEITAEGTLKIRKT